jgi:DNA replication protein DnaC
LLDWCVSVADQRVHGTTHEKPAERFARAEKLIPVDHRPPAPRERIVIRRVPSDCYVALETNRYPVSFDWMKRDVEVQVLAEEIVIRSGATESVRYERIVGNHQLARWQGAPDAAQGVVSIHPVLRARSIYPPPQARPRPAIVLLRGGGPMIRSPRIERIQEQLQRLRLIRLVDELPSLLQDASKKDLAYSDFLEEVLSREIAAKHERLTTMKTAMARFPFHKTLDSFDFKFQPSIDPKVIKDLATCRFIADTDNVLLLGPPGVGKTHLAVALGLKACALGYRTAFTTAAGLIATLTRAHTEGRLEERLKLLVQPKLLIIDEIGYLPLDRLAANLFFQLVSRRYEKGAILITSNQSLTVWGEVFGDRVIATAILDRLLHHSTIVNIKGESYRLKEKRKAGLLTRSEPFTDPVPRSDSGKNAPTPEPGLTADR